MYAKLIDGKIRYAPNPIQYNGRDVFTSDPTPYGYKPVVIPAEPEKEGYIAVFDGWEETDTEIVQKWRLEEVTDISDAEALAIITGEVET